MVVALVIACAAVVALAGFHLWSSTHGLLATRRRRKVIVTLKTGEAFSGVLFASDRDAVVLREATAIAFGPKAENVTVEGEALILRSDIAYMQLP